MGTIIGTILFIIFITNAYDWYKRKSLPRKIFQQAKSNSEELNRLFYKSCIPLIYDMRALAEAYEKGLKILNETQANKFFSYPKTYIIDESDNLIVNEVNLGPAKECCLLQFGWDLGYGYTTSYEPRYSLIKKKFDGCMVVEDYKYDAAFTIFSKKVEKEMDTDRLSNEYKTDIEAFRRSKDNIIGVSESAFKKFSYVLPEKYKNLYEDLKNNDYTTEEMQNKYKKLYKESIEIYDKEVLNKYDNYVKEKYKKAIENKEKVGKFWESGGPFGVIALNRDLNKSVSDEEWEKDEEINKKYTGSGFRNLDLIEKYSGDDKRVIEEYGLE